ncbi:MAG: hypothetical protein LBS08_01485 [Candidatus Symbiothrix sp.]|nr:hypothetical protein [Candidatus Symbiothrix sp.]
MKKNFFMADTSAFAKSGKSGKTSVKSLFLMAALVANLMCATVLWGQSANDFKYRRSSLSMVLVDFYKFDVKDTIVQIWNEYPFPDKYDKHDISFKIAPLGNESLDAKGIAALVMGKTDIQAKIDSVIEAEHIGRQLVAKWFNRSGDGKFDMELIQQRGYYNASELDAAIAQQSARGSAALADAGEELLNNTFVSFTQFMFFNNELVAKIIRETAYEVVKGQNGLVQLAAKKAADVLYDKTKDGKTLFSKTWLYKLVWNEEVAATFYNVWNNPAEFDKLDFKLELVGVQTNSSIVLFALDGAIEAIKKVEVRNIDHVYAELQKKYDVFKPKVPVLTAPEPLTAQIGMKEGLEGGEKFEVLEMTEDPETGRTKYVRIGTTTVEKKLVWDNRYNGGDAPESEIKGKDGNPITATHFKKVGKAQPGMLLKQIK